MSDQPTCGYPGCKSTDIELFYLGKPVCRNHWARLATMTAAQTQRVMGVRNPGSSKIIRRRLPEDL